MQLLTDDFEGPAIAFVVRPLQALAVEQANSASISVGSFDGQFARVAGLEWTVQIGIIAEKGVPSKAVSSLAAGRNLHPNVPDQYFLGFIAPNGKSGFPRVIGTIF